MWTLPSQRMTVNDLPYTYQEHLHINEQSCLYICLAVQNTATCLSCRWSYFYSGTKHRLWRKFAYCLHRCVFAEAGQADEVDEGVRFPLWLHCMPREQAMKPCTWMARFSDQRLQVMYAGSKDWCLGGSLPTFQLTQLMCTVYLAVWHIVLHSWMPSSTIAMLT